MNKKIEGVWVTFRQASGEVIVFFSIFYITVTIVNYNLYLQKLFNER